MNEVSMMGNISSLWQRRANRALLAFDITLSQYNLILLARRKGAISLSAAAAELRWDKPTMTLVARKCVAKGWLSMKRVMADKRSTKVSLTGQGEEVLDRVESARVLWPQVLGDPLDILDPSERSELRRMLDKVERRSRDVLT